MSISICWIWASVSPQLTTLSCPPLLQPSPHHPLPPPTPPPNLSPPSPPPNLSPPTPPPPPPPHPPPNTLSNQQLDTTLIISWYSYHLWFLVCVRLRCSRISLRCRYLSVCPRGLCTIYLLHPSHQISLLLVSCYNLLICSTRLLLMLNIININNNNADEALASDDKQLIKFFPYTDVCTALHTRCFSSVCGETSQAIRTHDLLLTSAAQWSRG